MHAGSLVLAAIAVVSVALPTPPGVRRQVSQSATVAADVKVEIYSPTGSVLVTGWDRREVRVEGDLGEGVERLAFESDDDDVEIRVIVPRGRRRDNEIGVGGSNLEIMVPRGASLDIETLAASIEVEDVDGHVSMDSSAGNVTYAGEARRLEAGSAAGDIVLQTSATDARIDVEGVAGDILVQLAGGGVDVSTLTGTLRIIGGRIVDASVESVSGKIYFEGEIGRGAELDFENFDGDIELLLPPETSASFDISTYSGSIETEFGYRGQAVEPYSPEQEAAFVLGDGGADVSIETFSGVIRVRRR